MQDKENSYMYEIAVNNLNNELQKDMELGLLPKNKENIADLEKLAFTINVALQEIENG